MIAQHVVGVHFNRINFVMTVLSFIFQSDSPADSDLSALDHYLLVSMIFVFGTLVEFALVLFLNRKFSYLENSIDDHVDKVKNETNRSGRISSNDGKEEKLKTVEAKIKPWNPSGWRSDIKSMNAESEERKIFRQIRVTNNIDFISFFLFNLSYLFFNIIYWAKYVK